MSAITGEDLVAAIVEVREDEVLVIVQALLAQGIEPQAIVERCREAMCIIGKRFEDGRAFIPELIMAGEMMKGVVATLEPLLQGSGSMQQLGTVVICTVKGDIHDIGKDIVSTMLDIAGFEVVDLGVDTPVATIVEKVREVHPEIVALSGLLTIAFDSMKATVAAIDEAGLHDGLKIMIGGAPVNDDVRVFAGADGWARDAVGAGELAKAWAGGA
jgi:methanogenic corrinoid protein MtbC1